MHYLPGYADDPLGIQNPLSRQSNTLQPQSQGLGIKKRKTDRVGLLEPVRVIKKRIKMQRNKRRDQLS